MRSLISRLIYPGASRSVDVGQVERTLQPGEELVWQETTLDERIGLIICPPADTQRWIVFLYGNGMTVAGTGLFDDGLAAQDAASPASNTLATMSVPGHLQNTVATAPRMRLLHTCNGRHRYLLTRLRLSAGPSEAR
jgi:hypothetical protein